MQNYTVVIEKDGETIPLKIKASDLLELNKKLSKYKYDTVLQVLDNTYEKELLKNLKKEMTVSTVDIYSNELARNKMSRTKKFVV